MNDIEITAPDIGQWTCYSITRRQHPRPLGRASYDRGGLTAMWTYPGERLYTLTEITEIVARHGWEMR